MNAADPKRAARAIDALRRGWPIRISAGTAFLTLLAIETATDDSVLESGGAAALLVSHARAATLKLTNQVSAADCAMPVIINAPAAMNVMLATAIADPALDLAYPMKGPFSTRNVPDGRVASAALEIARLARLLPAFLVLSDETAEVTQVDVDDVLAFTDAGGLRIATRARLPVAAALDAELVAYRSMADATDHVALVIGQRDGSAPVVRLHSECLTGDVLGSLKCDCGPQLHEALAQIAGGQWGILLYLRQEGRAIGLVNKLRAYALQDQGYDTVDANIRLGFAVDARDFTTAAAMLRLLSVSEVRLLTNNPAKVAGLEAQQIRVLEQLPLKIPPNPHNQGYLDTKRDRTGHLL